jgi:hypothetical protein
MCKHSLWVSGFRVLAALCTASACTLASCGFISLERLGVRTYPADKDGIVQTTDSVWLEFSESVERAAAETLFKVQDPQGSVAGDRRWSDNRLEFIPLSPWVPGTRYVLRFVGSVDTEDGRTYPLNVIVPFFGGSRESPPRLLTFAPALEAILGTSDALSFTFSAPMDVELFEEHFNLNPSSDHTPSWNLDQTTCTVTPKPRWRGLSRYTWSIPTEIRNALGVPLAEEYRGCFRVIQDTTGPTLQSVRGAAWDDGSGGFVLYDLAFLDNDMVLWFEFSEGMDWDTWTRAFSIEPAVQALTTYVSSRVVTVDPEGLWIPEQEYSVTISTDLTDIHGNRPDAEMSQTFASAVPAQRLVQIENEPALTAPPVYTQADWASGDPLEIEIEDPPGQHTFTLQFSEPYEAPDVERLINAILLESAYPPTISDPTLESISFEAVSPQRLILTYGGFQNPPGTAVRHFYRLIIPADKAATANAAGSYLTEAVTIHFEVADP